MLVTSNCRTVITVLLLSVLLALPAGLNQLKSSNAESTSLPFDGLKLVYDANFPVLTTSPLTSFNGIITCSFSEVTATSSTVAINIQGTLMVEQDSQSLVVSQSMKLPTDKDNIFFLLPQTTPNRENPIKITSILLSIKSWQLNLSGDFYYEGDMPVATPQGTFSTYRLHNKTHSNDINIDIYLHYEKDTKLMIYGEVNAQSSLFSYKYTIKLKESNVQLTTGGGVQPTSECIIATAAFGSELSPEVQFLRGFRDNSVLSTASGNEFMKVFNAWYYSFSPSVACYLRSHGPEREIVKCILYPLVGVLKFTTFLSDSIIFNKEFSIIFSGVFASALIGLVYFTPIMTPILYSIKRYLNLSFESKYMKYLLAVQMGALGLTGIGAFLQSSSILLASSATLVLSTATAVSCYTSMKILLYCAPK
ncbi:CFI-box-CTERM domain-containing protein [[Eubacterium] cellulosolvens]